MRTEDAFERSSKCSVKKVLLLDATEGSFSLLPLLLRLELLLFCLELATEGSDMFKNGVFWSCFLSFKAIPVRPRCFPMVSRC